MKPCAFFDRDGTIIVGPESNHRGAWSDDLIITSAVQWVAMFNAVGCLVIVVSNQSGIASGKSTADLVATFNRKMVEAFGTRGARIDDVLICPHAEKQGCQCRKPKPGMVHSAQAKWKIDLAHSIVFGDSDSDRQLATDLGLRFVSVASGAVITIS